MGAYEFGSGADPWTDLGGGSPGVAGVPLLVGAGPLTAGSELSLQLSSAPPGALMLLWIGTSSTPLPIFGGTLHAFPFVEQVLLATDGAGSFFASTPWFPGVPSGTEVWFQFLIQDVTTVYGITLSNGVRGTTP